MRNCALSLSFSEIANAFLYEMHYQNYTIELSALTQESNLVSMSRTSAV